MRTEAFTRPAHTGSHAHALHRRSLQFCYDATSWQSLGSGSARVKSVMNQEEYWRMFHLVRGDVEAAIGCSATYLTINRISAADYDTAQKLNRHADFWRKQPPTVCSHRFSSHWADSSTRQREHTRLKMSSIARLSIRAFLPKRSCESASARTVRSSVMPQTRSGWLNI